MANRMAQFRPIWVDTLPNHAGHVVHYEQSGPNVRLVLPSLDFYYGRRRPVLWAAPGTIQRVHVADVGLINLEAEALDVDSEIVEIAVDQRPSTIEVLNGTARRLELVALDETLARFTVNPPDPNNSFVDTFGITRLAPGDLGYETDPGVLVGVQIYYDRQAIFTRPDPDGLYDHLGSGYPAADLPSLGPLTSSVVPSSKMRENGPRAAEVVVTRGTLEALAPPLRKRLMIHVIRRATARGCAVLLTRPGPVPMPVLMNFGFNRSVGNTMAIDLHSRGLHLHVVAAQRELEGLRR